MKKKVCLLLISIVMSVAISGVSVTAICGDAVLEPGEACDDGNNIHGDGCDALCNLEFASELALNISDKVNEINTTLQDKDSFKANVSDLATQNSVNNLTELVKSLNTTVDTSHLATQTNVSSILSRLDDGSFGLQAIRNLVQTVINDIFNLRAEVQQNVSVIQADLDNPDQYKANTSGLATTENVSGLATQSSVNTVQADLDNPDQYKADVSGLATQNNVTDLKTQLNEKASQSSVDSVQADLDNPDQYKADVSGLATQTNISFLETQLNLTTLKSLIEIKANQSIVDWIHMQVDNNSRYVDDEEFAAAIANLATEVSVQMIKDIVNNTDQFKADVSALATSSDISSLLSSLNDLATQNNITDLKSLLSVAQSDLDNPDQYKADISGLATQTNVSTLEALIATKAAQSTVDWIHMQVDNNSRYVDDEELANAVSTIATQSTVEAILAAINNLNLSNLDAPVSTRASQSSVDALQSDITMIKNTVNNTDQFKADVSALATSSDISSLLSILSTLATQTNISFLETQLNLTTLKSLVEIKANQSTVDWIHMQVDNDSRYVDDDELAAALVNITTQTSVEIIKEIVNNTDQFKADVSGLATQMNVTELQDLVATKASQSTVDWIHMQVDNDSRYVDDDEFAAAIANLATQTAVELILAAITNLNITNLDVAVSTRASQTSVDAVQADLDNPGQYKADVSGLATQDNVTDLKSSISIVQSDLDNPDQYKADVSGLANQSSVNEIKTAVDLLNLTNLENLDVSVSSRASQTSVDTLQSDISMIKNTINNTDQFKADISALATQANVSTLEALIATKAAQSTVDWIHMQVDNNSRYVDDEEFASAIANIATQATVSIIKDIVNNTDQFKADVSGLASQSTVDEIKTAVDQLNLSNLEKLDALVSSRASQTSVDALQSDISMIKNTVNNTDQFKADVSSLAAEATVQMIKDIVNNTDQFKADTSSLATQVSVDNVLNAVNLLNLSNLEKLDELISSRASQSSVDAVQADLDNPDQYKADVSALATQNNVTDLKAQLSEKASQSTVDWIHMQVDNDSRYIDDEEFATAIANLATQSSVDTIQSQIDMLDLSNLERLDVNVSTRATQQSVDELQSTLDNAGFGLGAITSFITQVLGIVTDSNNVLNNGDNFVNDAELENALAQIDPMINCDVCKKLDDIMMNISSLRGFNKANFDFLTTNSQEILTGVETVENNLAGVKDVTDDTNDKVMALDDRITDLEEKLDLIIQLLDDSQSVCGDGLIEGMEQCDDGNNINGDGCSNVCKIEFCGDGTLQVNLGEECDDGNSADGDGCSALCELEQQAVCGNGVQETGEECDLGNENGNICIPQYEGMCDFCTSSCQENTVQGGSCGDTIVNGPEQCDDGNNQTGDGCNALCQTEECQVDADCPTNNICNANFICESLDPSTGNVTFRTNVVEGKYFSCLKYDECWIAVDFDEDGDLEALAFEQKNSECEGGERLVVTPEGYDVYKYGHEYRVRLCDNENRQTIFDLRVATNDLELSKLPTEPFSSNGQEAYD